MLHAGDDRGQDRSDLGRDLGAVTSLWWRDMGRDGGRCNRSLLDTVV